MTATDTETETPVITEPGVFLDLTDEQYLRDPVPGYSLSSTGARSILAPGCPAKFRWEQINGSPASTPAQEFGSAFHRELLGSGPELVIVEVDNWTTKVAQQARRDARARGAVALLAREYVEVQAMVAALRGHKTAGAIFEPGSGVAEQSLFWRDEQTGVMCRARLDWTTPDGVYDAKSTVSCWPEDIARTIAKYRYHQQAAFYLDGARVLGLDVKPRFTLVFQEKTPPYLPVVVPLDARALEIGRERNRWAIDLYAKCLREDHWPGFGDDGPVEAPLPTWCEIEHDLMSDAPVTSGRDGW